MRLPLLLAAPLSLALVAVGCGSSDGGGSSDGPRLVVTTSVLGDVVEQVVGDDAEVTVLIPSGSDPHQVQLSAREVNDLRSADAVVANGAGFEEGLLDALAAAEADGVPLHEAIDDVATLELAPPHDHAHDEAEGSGDGAGQDGAGDPRGEVEGEDHPTDAEHEDEDEDDHSHASGDVDPHFFTDPERMADAVAGITDFLAGEVASLDTPEVRERAGAYEAELRALALAVDETLAPIPAERRVMVTAHDVFGYFADRFDLEVVGVVLPGGGTHGAPNAADLDHLVDDVEAAGVEVVFTDAASSSDLAETLADEAGGLSVVTLLTESLAPEGEEGDTYVGMITTNAERIASALA